jgi:hypothetical protein
MKRVAAAAALVLGAWLLIPIQHADAGSKASERCVTRDEYRKVHNGLKKARVIRIFDSPGRQMWLEGRYEIRSFVPCSSRQFGYVNVNFKDGRVVAKRAFWG